MPHTLLHNGREVFSSRVHCSSPNIKCGATGQRQGRSDCSYIRSPVAVVLITDATLDKEAPITPRGENQRRPQPMTSQTLPLDHSLGCLQPERPPQRLRFLLDQVADRQNHAIKWGRGYERQFPSTKFPLQSSLKAVHSCSNALAPDQQRLLMLVDTAFTQVHARRECLGPSTHLQICFFVIPNERAPPHRSITRHETVCKASDDAVGSSPYSRGNDGSFLESTTAVHAHLRDDDNQS